MKIRCVLSLSLLLVSCGGSSEASEEGGSGPATCDGCDPQCHEDGSCDLFCPPTEDCAVDCIDEAVCGTIDCRDTENTCEVRCGDAATCELVDCTNANNCEVACSQAASCVIDCTNANNCDMIDCSDDAACTMLCTGANNCSFAQCDAGPASCDQGVVVCGAPCPACDNGECEPFEESSCPGDCA